VVDLGRRVQAEPPKSNPREASFGRPLTSLHERRRHHAANVP